MMPKNNTPGANSVLAKASLILGVFEAQPGPLTLTQIVAATGLPASSVHRLLGEHAQA